MEVVLIDSSYLKKQDKQIKFLRHAVSITEKFAPLE